MTNTSKNLHPNTVAFSCLEDSVAILIADIIHAIYSILNWRQSSKSFLIEILARLGEENKFECSHLNFAEILFPSLEEAVRKVKVGRWSQKLFDDMRDSVFLAVIIVPRRTGQSENGKYYGLPTLYKRGKFWKLFRAIQDAAIDCDLLNLPLRNRRQKVRAIVELWLMKNGAKRIVREKKETSEREKSEKEKAAPTCKCDCASCASCANRPRANVEVLRRRPNEVYEEWLEKVSEEYYRWLLDVGDFGDKFRFRVKRAMHEIEAQTNRAGEMMVSSKTNGKLRLVGGQPK